MHDLNVPMLLKIVLFSHQSLSIRHEYKKKGIEAKLFKKIERGMMIHHRTDHTTFFPLNRYVNHIYSLTFKHEFLTKNCILHLLPINLVRYVSILIKSCDSVC